MQIDWITVSAQVLNFLVLVYLLKRFLYRPVTEAMARREEGIARRVHESQEREQAAERERERLHARLGRLEERRDAILSQAREEAETERARLLDQARQEAETARERWQAQIEAERERFLDQVRQHLSEGFESLARRALTDLAGAELEARMVTLLSERLAGLDAERLDALRTALEDSEGALTVTTSAPLAEEQRERLTRAVQERLRSGAKIRLGTDPDLLCGIELTAGGHRLGWSLLDYLEQFQERLGEALETRRAETRKRGAPEAAPPS